MDQQLTEQQNRQQKFFLVLPLIAIPMLTLFFWAMGGGKTSQIMAGDHQSGLNLLLPDAKKGSVSGNDKNASYELARQDSLKRLEAARQDPYYLSYGPNSDTTASAGLRLLDNKRSFSQYGYTDPNEQKVYNRLSELSTVLQQNQEVSGSYNTPRGYSQKDEEISSLKEDINRLQSMMMEMGSNKTSQDPEMDQINNVLENVLDIQHPARVQQRLKEKSSQNLEQVYGVGTVKTTVPYTLLDNKSVKDYANEYAMEPHKEDNRFFGLTNELGQADDQANSISAVVHENQTLVSGATVKLRLTEDVYINGIRIPKNEFIYGQAQLTGERLTVEIESIRYKNTLLPVALSVYDLDGQAGIRIPGTITRDVVKQNSNEAISSLSLGSFDQSIGAQAASAGIELGKNLFSKKIKLVKVEVKAGYKILLKDNKNKQNSSF
ncbi:MAG: conjugative transposon protein TraM [Sphingobacterium sp.]|jgi:conjugative transposon TraM protein|uniref:conjugative transposon protein TraM n=1 Tax=Sphingobacterium sp. TaxID=341027 RepID=UPI002846AD3F|nr:conjugative transposon protein TraM [Sphingobacterium sp.]MDR3008584.1 conjugative transposon protein TraM [Sphingobacterium sp.]